MASSFSLDECFQEFVLCARYGELQDAQEIIQYVLEQQNVAPAELSLLVNGHDAAGNTALHMAAANGHQGSLHCILLGFLAEIY